MISDSVPPASAPTSSTISLDDLLVAFTIFEWVEAPPYVSDLPETAPESNIRHLTEKKYQKATIMPTAWHRYLTLGRYVTNGSTFDASGQEMVTDPLKIRCMIWYRYTYHLLDHGLEIPFKLLEWATRSSQSYLSSHANSSLSLDTKKVTWQSYSRSLSLSNAWSEVPSKSKKKDNPKSTRPATSTTSHQPSNRPQPETIVEETSNSSASTTCTTRGWSPSKNKDQEGSVVSDGKQSARIHNTNVPVCDGGTYWVIFRLKLLVSDEQMRVYRVPTTMKEEICFQVSYRNS